MLAILAGLAVIAFHILDAKAAQLHLHVIDHGINLVLNHHGRIVEFALGEQGIQHLFQIGVFRLAFGPLTQGGADILFEILDGVNVRSDGLGKFVGDLRFLVRFNVIDLHSETSLLAGVNTLPFGRPSEHKFLFVASLQAQQRLIKPRGFHRIFLIRRHVPIRFIEDDGFSAIFAQYGGAVFIDQNTAHIDIQHIAILAGAIDIHPAGLLVAIFIQLLFNSRLINGNGIFFYPQSAVVAQIDVRIEWHG